MQSVEITEVAESSADYGFHCFCTLSSLTDFNIIIGSTNGVVLGMMLLKVAFRGCV